ncbi:hypothetical protein B0A49_10495 [Cryomyces minteri]|uniref:Neutral ceramidase n=1 Tax=Cryomyces minteri TaxID=331657 RepID=A0A4U0WFU3_9PEZI|nr:hypothetical protein B0A49_10495 [Cryomyces minteri]
MEVDMEKSKGSQVAEGRSEHPPSQRTKRPHFMVALAAATFTLLAIATLLYSLGVPNLDYRSWRLVEGNEWTASVQDDAKLATWRAGNQGTNISSTVAGDLYLLGVGKADITGPVVEINLMGYADPKQLGTGLRQRLYSRAFIIGDTSKPEDRFVYLVLDTQSGDTAVRHGILDGLRALGPEYGLYGQRNVAVTGTHSHSGPAAWLNYLLPQITSRGFDKQSYSAIVNGALLSICRAHESLSPGSLSIGSTNIEGANINRSPYAYLANPEEERKHYEHDVDKDMTVLKFRRDEDGRDIGVLTWFPVHGTSMLGNNTLITGDNKGVAAYLFEQSVRKSEGNAAEGFVAGFSQANVGDTSPNVLGAYCEFGPSEGQECDFETSLCDGRNEACHGRGPYFGLEDAGTKSCYEIGKRQYEGAMEVYKRMEEDTVPVRGRAVKSLHTFRDLSNYTFPHPNGTVVSTCPAALGYSFAAGTTDGPGAFDFKQNNSGKPDANPVWSAVGGFLHSPNDEQRACHGAKPILLDVGETTSPYLWSPNIVDIQLLRVGQLLIIVSPGEATTMAGRRWKAALASHARDTGFLNSDDRKFADEPIVLLGGPANSYTHYIATEEEYAIQRYEGASTLYGPHTLNAYIDLTRATLPYLGSHAPGVIDPGPSPPIHTNKSLSFITGVVYDRPGFSKHFGQIVTDARAFYTAGDTVSATFIGANPRNNLRLEQTYAAVERLGNDGTWSRVRDDADWELVFEWKRTNKVLATSEVTVSWETSERTERGTYRLRYYGDAKAFGSGVITEFEGISGEFFVR